MHFISKTVRMSTVWPSSLMHIVREKKSETKTRKRGERSRSRRRRKTHPLMERAAVVATTRKLIMNPYCTASIPYMLIPVAPRVQRTRRELHRHRHLIKMLPICQPICANVCVYLFVYSMKCFHGCEFETSAPAYNECRIHHIVYEYRLCTRC